MGKKFWVVMLLSLISFLFLTGCNSNPTNFIPASTATPNTPTNPANPKVTSTPGRPTAAPPTPASVDANLGAPFAITKGEKKTILNENLRIEYTGINDSRCPANVVCAWAGMVEVDLVLTTKNTQVSKFTLSLFGNSGVGLQPTGSATPSPRSDNNNTKIVDGYSIRLLGVDPYRGLETTNPPVYSVTLVIEKA
jgi:hypothetical protein